MGSIESTSSEITVPALSPDKPVFQPVVLKNGQAGLRFGPVVTGYVALGKDGCGY